MNVAEIILIGLALAVDATVYSFSYGLVLKQQRALSALWLALTVGLYQALMPLFGYLFGCELKQYVAAYAPLLVLTVFGILGAYIIYSAWTGEEGDEPASSTPLSFAALMLVGVATAIDALAVGTGMALGNIGGIGLNTPLLMAEVSIIGTITFCCSLGAFHSTRILRNLPTRWAETLAGLLLIGLGAHAVW